MLVYPPFHGLTIEMAKKYPISNLMNPPYVPMVFPIVFPMALSPTPGGSLGIPGAEAPPAWPPGPGG